MSLIKVENLSVGYDGIPVEKDISFSVNKGDYLCIVGENGSGKSTLMKTLLGLIPPVRGSIVFGDDKAGAEEEPVVKAGKSAQYSALFKAKDHSDKHADQQSDRYSDQENDDKDASPEQSLSEENSPETGINKPGTDLPGHRISDTENGGSGFSKAASKRRGKGTIGGIGYLPQQTLVQRDFPASVGEVVISGCQGRCGLRPFYSKEDKALADANMERMGILKLKNRSYRELSGGQQQRVLLARALCATGTLLLLDEPVSGLDPKVTMEMYDLIKKLNDEGITIIMITHDIKVATMYASHILHLGTKYFFGTTDSYLSSKAGKFLLLRQKGGVCL